MFPFNLEDENQAIEENEAKIFTEYGINFKTGQLTGKIVEELEAVKVWAWLALKTDRYYYQQYSWQYGCEINTLIGKSYSEDLIKTEVSRMIKECLTINEHITDIENFECLVEGDKITASFTIISDYGEVEMSV